MRKLKMGKTIQAWRAKSTFNQDGNYSGYTDYDFLNFKKLSKLLSKEEIQETLDKYFEKVSVFVEENEGSTKEIVKRNYKIFKKVVLLNEDKIVFQDTKTGKVTFR